MNPLLVATIHRSIAALVPGTAANIAERKRRLERKLRAQGHSRGHAKAMVAQRFSGRG